MNFNLKNPSGAIPAMQHPERSFDIPAVGNPWQKFVCSLNFLLAILGYPLVMALLSPVSAGVVYGETSIFTYPFRAVQMAIAALAFLAVRNRPTPSFNWKMCLVVFFWVAYCTRCYWDLFVARNVPPGQTWYHACYVVIEIVPLLAIVKGWNAIDFPRVLKWILVFGGLGLLGTLRNLDIAVAESWTGETGRFAASAMMHTQALGHFSCAMSICALWAFLDLSWKQIVWRGLAVVVGLLALYMMLEAGSRGPVFGLAIVICLWFGGRSRNVVIGVIVACFCAMLFAVFYEQILSIIKDIAPTMAARLDSTVESGDTAGRTDLWVACWDECLRNPVFGYQFDRVAYPHSMFLDGFMMFGLVFGWIIAVLIFLGVWTCYQMLKNRVENFWWVLLLLHQLSQSFTQSGFSATAIQAPLLLIFIREMYLKKLAGRRFPIPPLPPRNLPVKPSAEALPREREQS